MATVRLSKKWTLQWQDVLRGAVVSAFSSVAGVAYQAVNDAIINHVAVTINWSNILNIAIVAFIGYVGKNFGFEPPKVITTTDSNTKAVNATEKIKEAV